MIIKLPGVLMLFALFLGHALIAQTSGGIFPYRIHEEKLDNGFKIVVIPMDSPGLVAYYSVVRTGSRDEYEPGHSGFAHFFEHMMYRGTEKYPGPVYDRLMTGMGADGNAYTSNDITCYHLNFTREDLEKVMELESDRFQNLSYGEDVFKTEAGAVHGEYLKSLSNPYSVLNEKLMDTAFDEHTYKHTTIGFKKDVEAMPTMYAYSKSFFARYYRPENVVVIVAGDVEPATVFDLSRKYYGRWARGYVPPLVPAEPEQKKEKRAEAKFNGRTLPILTVAYKALAFDPSNIDMASCMLLGELMFDETSEIHKKLVLDEQRVQFIQADFGSARDPELMTVFAMVKEENDLKNIENEIYSTIALYQSRTLDKKRLDDLKSNYKYSYLMRLNTPQGAAGSLARYTAMTGGIEAVNTLYATLDRVTPESVRQAAVKFLVPEKRTVVIVKGR